MFCIHTDSGKYYYAVEKNGKMCLIQSERTYNHDALQRALSQKPIDEWGLTEKWLLRGFCEVLPFGQIGQLRTIEDMVSEPLTFKNGKGKYLLADYDHGTNRLWGDRINSIWEIDKDVSHIAYVKTACENFKV